MSCQAFQVPITDAILEDCIELVRGISFRGKEHDFKVRASDNGYARHLKQIHRREKEGSWRTWFRRNSKGKIDAAAFFQRMDGGTGPFVMCFGFDKNLLDEPSDRTHQQYDDFIESLSDPSNQQSLGYYIQHCLSEVPVFIVDQNSQSPHRDRDYDSRRDELLLRAMDHFASSMSHPHWMMRRSGPMTKEHWGCSRQPDGIGLMIELNSAT